MKKDHKNLSDALLQDVKSDALKHARENGDLDANFDREDKFGESNYNNYLAKEAKYLNSHTRDHKDDFKIDK